MGKSIASAFLLLVIVLAAGARGPGAAHLANSDCAQCHLAGKAVTAQQAGILLASQEALCGKCHPAAILVSHPTGFQPAVAPPAAFPLDWKGDLTCSTCHEVHASGPGLMRGALAGKQLCLGCHQSNFFTAMRDGGASLTSGHLVKEGSSDAPPLDRYSLKCLECHGANAPARLATTIDHNGVLRHAGESVNHPIGASYQKAVAFGGYRARQVVERKLLLPDGKISCVSCHGGYQREHGKLAVAMDQSRLCFECHAL